MVMRDGWAKKTFSTGRGVGVRRISAGFWPEIDLEKFACDRRKAPLSLTRTGGEDAASTDGQEALLPALAGYTTLYIMRRWGLILCN